MFFFEVFFSQFILFYLFYLFLSTFTLFYTIVIFLLIVTHVSFITAYFNLDLFMILLLLVELVVFFVLIIFYFFIAVYDVKIKNSKISFFFYCFFLCAFLINSNILNESTFCLIWNDYFELFNNFVNNDFFILYLNFYNYYVHEFLIFGLLLVFVSLNTILLFNFFKLIKTPSLNFFLNYNFFFFNLNTYFFKIQNIFYQGSFKAIIKTFKKKQ